MYRLNATFSDPQMLNLFPLLQQRFFNVYSIGVCLILFFAGYQISETYFENPEPENAQFTCDQYRMPLQLDDGWRTAHVDDLDLRCDLLEDMSAAIKRGDYRNVHAVLIFKDARLVYEEYFEGLDRRPESSDYGQLITHRFDRESLHTTRSAGKSFTSALIGIALEKGSIDSLDAPLLSYFPGYDSSVDNDAWKISLRHVLTMSAGLDWNEDELSYAHPENDERLISESAEPELFLLKRPVVDEPGTRWEYNSGLSAVLGSVISRATGKTYGSYARENLFAPLDIQRFDWTGPTAWAGHPAYSWDGDEDWPNLQPRAAQPAGSLWLKPRDMLKFGYIYLNGGRWKDRQIISDDWIAESLAPQIERFSGSYPNGTKRRAAYGYQWWYDEFTLPYGNVTVHTASGNGGQKIWIIPSLGLSVVHLAGNYNMSRYGWEADRLLYERILPWAMGIDTNYHHQSSLSPVNIDSTDWQITDYSIEDNASYTGIYNEGGEEILIRELDGRLQLLPPIGMGPLDLIPLGERTFGLGALQNGQATHAYLPDEKLVFIVNDNGEVLRYEYRAEGEVLSIGDRVR